jgi:hypothetical protein
VLLKKLFAAYRKEVVEAENQAISAELKTNFKDYMALTKERR